jgi:hypothetical protein
MLLKILSVPQVTVFAGVQMDVPSGRRGQGILGEGLFRANRTGGRVEKRADRHRRAHAGQFSGPLDRGGRIAIGVDRRGQSGHVADRRARWHFGHARLLGAQHHARILSATRQVAYFTEGIIYEIVS